MKKNQLSKVLLDFVRPDKGKYDEREVLEARLIYPSNNVTAKALGIPRRTVDRTIQRILDRAEKAGEISHVPQPKVLVMDIETAPMAGYLWSLFKPLFNHNMLERRTYILSWAAKWLHEDEVMCDALCFDEDYKPGNEDDTRMLKGIWDLLDEADFVVAHNGDRFDIKLLNTGFLMCDAIKGPPSPYKSIDTLKMVKRTFRFDSNRLDFLLQEMYGEGKDDAGGFETWRGCMTGDKDAWATMLKYNKADVTKLERLYLDIRCWDKNHPSVLTRGGSLGVRACPVCGSQNVKPTWKTASTNVSKFPTYLCGDCGAWSRGRHSVLMPDEKEALLVVAK